MNNVERILAFIFEHPGCDTQIIYASLKHTTGTELIRLSRLGRIVWKGPHPGGGWFLNPQEWTKRSIYDSRQKIVGEP